MFQRQASRCRAASPAFFACANALLLIDNAFVTHPGCTNAKRMRTFTEHDLTAAVQKTTQRCMR
jgi:hypothetical protein